MDDFLLLLFSFPIFLPSPFFYLASSQLSHHLALHLPLPLCFQSLLFSPFHSICLPTSIYHFISLRELGVYISLASSLSLYPYSVCSNQFWFLGSPQCSLIFSPSACVPEPKVFKRKCFKFQKQHYHENALLGDRGLVVDAIWILPANVNLGKIFILIITANTKYLVHASDGFKYSTYSNTFNLTANL